MGPLCHLGLTSTWLAGHRLAGSGPSLEVIITSLIGGVLLDGDKVFEVYHRKFKQQVPDITARDRLLHSVLAFPFGFGLSWWSGSWLPLGAVLLHIAADSFIPGLKYAGKHYPPHSPWKWLLFPIPASWWYQIVPKGWPIQYPPQFNRCYQLAEPVGLALTLVADLILWLY